MTNLRLTKDRLAKTIETTALRCRSLNDFGNPILLPSLVLWLILSVPSLHSTPGSLGRWAYFATGFLSLFSTAVTFVVWRETNTLDDALTALKDGELEQSEAFLKQSLLSPKGKR